MDPSLLCQVFFSLGTIVSIGGTLIPSFRKQIMTYGSRNTAHLSHEESELSQGKFERLWRFIVSIQVPHSWFAHYYVVSVVSSVFWGIQFYTQGRALQFLASYSTLTDATMTKNQILLSWVLMAIQGTRRLWESIIFARPTESRMWVGLWILGTVFYIAMGISVWIEGIAVIVGHEAFPVIPDITNKVIVPRKTIIAIPIFLTASGVQHICHRQLANLNKYSLPNHYFFRKVLCPHYTSECLIYLSIAILSAPPGQVVNQTVFAGLLFVVSNLAVTADTTREWYVEKFGEDLKCRSRMVPFVY